MERTTAVDLLVAFTNSVDHDEGTDDLTTPAELSRWLHANGLTRRRLASTADDLALALRLRAALHDAYVTNHDTAVDRGGPVPASPAAGNGQSGAAVDPLTAVATGLPLRLTNDGGAPGLTPVDGGVRGALGLLLVAVNRSVAEGTWPRLKVCSASDCSWVYFDATKNRSRAWCEWGCGNKAKTRSYRARRRVSA